MKKNTFTLKKSFFKPISNYSDERLGRLFRAIYQYQTGENPEPAEDVATAFSFFVAEFEEEEEKRMRRAEAARQRRLKKAAEAEKAQEVKPSKPKAKQVKKKTVETAAVVEMPVPCEKQNDVDVEKHSEKFPEFKKWMKQNAYKVYRSKGKDMTCDDYLLIMECFTENDLQRHVIEMHREPRYIDPSMSLSQNIFAKAIAERSAVAL